MPTPPQQALAPASSGRATAPDLTGRVALVTGGSRGIGAAIALRLARAGAVVAVTARTMASDPRLAGSLSDTVADIRRAGGDALAVRADLSLSADRRRLIDEVGERIGRIDILVNNAARSYLEPVVTFSARHYELMFELQVRAPFELSQLVIPQMRQAQAGWILNISSRASWHSAGPPYGSFAAMGLTAYGMCKAALERFTTGLAGEEHLHGIRVNALSPWETVATPGASHHDLTDTVTEDVSVMADAALILVSADITGRLAYSARLLEEFRARR